MNATFTNEQDRWLDANVNGMGRSWVIIAERFNSRFGTSRTPDSIRRRSAYILIPAPSTRYSEEQDRWLKAHSYVDRKTMTRMFNEEFGTERTRRSIEQRCAKVKAYKLIEVTGEYKSQCIWTDAIDQWIIDNVRRFRGRHKDMVRELNHLFGTRFTERAVSHRKWMLKAKDNGYYELEDRWILEHLGMKPKKMTELFNETFSECRSVDGLSKHRRILLQKYSPDEENGTSDESYMEKHETTPHGKIDKGEAVL